jgi:hypothetical protein
MLKYNSIILIALVIALCSCESTFKDVQSMNTVEFSPIGQTENINLKYTDSGKVKAILVSPLMLDYSHLEHGFNEFPKGVHVTLLDDTKQKSYIESDYAITYENTRAMAKGWKPNNCSMTRKMSGFIPKKTLNLLMGRAVSLQVRELISARISK